MPDPPVENDELLYRRIPSRAPELVEGRISSINFKLGKDEDGLSVDRSRFVSVTDALSIERGALANSWLASATVGEIRNLKDGADNELHLDVIPDDQSGAKPGHALIIVQDQKKLTSAASKALQRLFSIRELIDIATDAS